MTLDGAKNTFAGWQKKLGAKNFVRNDQLRGADPETIDALSASLGVAIPEAYREFLAWMGEDASDVFDGARTAPRDVEQHQAACRSRLEDQDDTLPPDAIVFYGHGGYHYRWIRTNEGDDPIIHEFVEGTPPKVTTVRFSAFVEAQIDALGRRLSI